MSFFSGVIYFIVLKDGNVSAYDELLLWQKVVVVITKNKIFRLFLNITTYFI